MSTNIYPLKKVSTLAGSGKTEQVIDQSIKLAKSGELVIIAVPSISKVQEIERNLKEKIGYNPKVLVHAIYSDDSTTESVYERITDITNDLFSRKIGTSLGAIVILTHEGFLICNNIQRKDHWHLYWDEAHTVFHHITGVMLKELKNLYLDDLLTFTEHETHTTGSVCPDKVDTIRERLKSNSIGIRDSRDVRTLTGHLLSASQGYCEIILNKNHRDSKDLDIIFLYNPLPFVGYKSTTILGALLEHTNLYKWFVKMGIQFIPDHDFTGIIKTNHSEKISVYYANTTHRHTRAFLDKEFKGKPVRDHFREAVMEVLNNIPEKTSTLVMANKDNHKNKEFIHYNFGPPGSAFVLCPWNNMGMNGFSESNALLYIGTFNPNTQYHALISNYGVEDFTAHYHFYQTLMRLSIRNGKEVSVFIPCLSLITPLLEYFPNVEFIPLDVPEEIMNWRDQRKKEVPLDEWVILSFENMSKLGVPRRKNLSEYEELISARGYHKEILYVKNPESGRGKRKTIPISIMCQFSDSIEKAKKALEFQ